MVAPVFPLEPPEPPPVELPLPDDPPPPPVGGAATAQAWAQGASDAIYRGLVAAGVDPDEADRLDLAVTAVNRIPLARGTPRFEGESHVPGRLLEQRDHLVVEGLGAVSLDVDA